jgi:hypothetical protein
MLKFPHFLDNWVTDGFKVVSLVHWPPFTPPGRFLVLISVRGWIDPRAIVWVEISQLKNPVTSSVIEPATFQLVIQCLNQLCYCMHPICIPCQILLGWSNDKVKSVGFITWERKEMHAPLGRPTHTHTHTHTHTQTHTDKDNITISSGKTNWALSFEMTTEKIVCPTILLLLRVYSLPKECIY